MNGGGDAYVPGVSDVISGGGDGIGVVPGTALLGSVWRTERGDGPVPVPPSQRQGDSMADEWPLSSFLELGALAGAVPCARLHARQVVWEWGLTGLSQDIELLVSELITNAVQASQSTRQAASVRLWLLSERTRVLILVWDASGRPPVRMDADQEAEGGRGLMLVEAISDQWNWYSVQDREGGKVVWALSVLR
jgi:anti-sigma regulatory factor (Ser/Thr protein kinase)